MTRFYAPVLATGTTSPATSLCAREAFTYLPVLPWKKKTTVRIAATSQTEIVKGKWGGEKKETPTDPRHAPQTKREGRNEGERERKEKGKRKVFSLSLRTSFVFVLLLSSSVESRCAPRANLIAFPYFALDDKRQCTGNMVRQFG